MAISPSDQRSLSGELSTAWEQPLLAGSDEVSRAALGRLAGKESPNQRPSRLLD